MLILDTNELELYDDVKDEFIIIDAQHMILEHSLSSISEWESITHKPFLSNNQNRTLEETFLYIKCMTINKNKVDDRIYKFLPPNELKRIEDYIKDTRTATWFKEVKGRGNVTGETITSELIYFWMITYNIPHVFDKWHLNRLLTLIKVCSIKNNNQSKKMGKQDIYSQNRALNAARRKARNTKG